MKKYLLLAVIFTFTINTMGYANANSNLQISEKDKKIYTMRKNTQEYYGENIIIYHVDYVKKAEYCLKKDDYEKALKYNDLAIYYYDKNPLTYIIKAEICMYNNDIGNAKSNLQKAKDIREIKESKYQLYDTYTDKTMWVRIDKDLAKIALKEGNLELAHHYIKEIRANWQYFDSEVLLILSDILKAQGEEKQSNLSKDFVKILNDIDKAIRKNPNNDELYYDKATFLSVIDEGFALASINKAISISPKSEYLLFKAGLAKDKKQRLAILNEAVKQSPVDNYKVYTARGAFYYEEENFERALSDFQKALRYGCKDDGLIEMLAICSYNTENYQDALELFQQLLGNLNYDQNVIKENINLCKEQLNIK